MANVEHLTSQALRSRSCHVCGEARGQSSALPLREVADNNSWVGEELSQHLDGWRVKTPSSGHGWEGKVRLSCALNMSTRRITCRGDRPRQNTSVRLLHRKVSGGGRFCPHQSRPTPATPWLPDRAKWPTMACCSTLPFPKLGF